MKQTFLAYVKAVSLLSAPVAGGVLGAALVVACFIVPERLSHSPQSEADALILPFGCMAAIAGFLIGLYISWRLYRTL